MSDEKLEAEVLRMGIAAGYRSSADAAAWADSIIARGPHPLGLIIDISLGAHQDRSVIGHLLGQVPGDCAPLGAQRRVLGDLLRELEAGHYRPEEIAKLVYRLATSGFLPEEEFGWEAIAIDDAFELAHQRSLGSVADATARLLEFLRRHSNAPAA